MPGSVVAVIPGFDPEPDEVLTLVQALLAQDIPVLVVDDGSAGIAYLDQAAQFGATTVRHDTNAGIARSLNDGLAFALSQGAEWLLTVDQDTVLPDGYVTTLLAVVQSGAETRHGVGVVAAETVGDAAGDLRYPAHRRGGLLVTEEVFQTGSLWHVPALQTVGGFDEAFGIDAVDASACLRLREAGFLVVLAPGARLEHRYGSGQQVRLFGRSVNATGHSPQRRETMVRNRLRLFPREFRQSPVHAFRTLRRVGVNVLLGVTVEEDRWAKAKGAARGLLPPCRP